MKPNKYFLIALCILLHATLVLAGDDSSKAFDTDDPSIKPLALVAALYAEHQQVNMFQRADTDKFIRQYFTDNLATLFIEDVSGHPGEVGNLNFDPLYNAQDLLIEGFSLRLEKVMQNHAVVIATIKNIGVTSDIVFDLVQQDSQWRIENIHYKKDNEDYDLVGILKFEDQKN